MLDPDDLPYRVLMRARQDYNKALRAWDEAAQVKLETGEKN